MFSEEIRLCIYNCKYLSYQSKQTIDDINAFNRKAEVKILNADNVEVS